MKKYYKPSNSSNPFQSVQSGQLAGLFSYAARGVCIKDYPLYRRTHSSLKMEQTRNASAASNRQENRYRLISAYSGRCLIEEGCFEKVPSRFLVNFWGNEFPRTFRFETLKACFEKIKHFKRKTNKHNIFNWLLPLNIIQKTKPSDVNGASTRAQTVGQTECLPTLSTPRDQEGRRKKSIWPPCCLSGTLNSIHIFCPRSGQLWDERAFWALWLLRKLFLEWLDWIHFWLFLGSFLSYLLGVKKMLYIIWPGK